MTPKLCFESLLFVPFLTEESFIKNEHDPDVKFCSKFLLLKRNILSLINFKKTLSRFAKQLLSTLHLSILSINKNFDAFKSFYDPLNFNFSIICFFYSTNFNDINIDRNSSFQLPYCNIEYQIKKSGK